MPVRAVGRPELRLLLGANRLRERALDPEATSARRIARIGRLPAGGDPVAPRLWIRLQNSRQEYLRIGMPRS